MRIVLKVRDFALVDVVGYQVALGIENFYLVMMGGMEALSRQIRGVDDQFEPGVPSGIDACREDGVVTHVYLFNMAVVGDDGATVVLTGMELHALGVVLLVVMAIDTLGLFLETAEDIVVDDALVVGFQATLVDGERFVAYERGVDKTVTQVAVDTVGRHEDTEGFIVRPLVGFTGIDIDGDGVPLCLFGQSAPIVDGGLGFICKDKFLIANTIAGYHLAGFFIELEGEGGDVDGHGDVGIVGVYRWQGVDIGKYLGHRRTRTSHHCQTKPYNCYIPHIFNTQLICSSRNSRNNRCRQSKDKVPL